jgi:hypothetical protein
MAEAEPPEARAKDMLFHRWTHAMDGPTRCGAPERDRRLLGLRGLMNQGRVPDVSRLTCSAARSGAFHQMEESNMARPTVTKPGRWRQTLLWTRPPI